MTMNQEQDKRQGYSLVEMLVVLVIVGVLSLVATTMLVGNRAPGATRALLDELEGTLMAAQKLAVATSQDVTIATQGDWSYTSPLILAMTSSPASPGSSADAANIIAQGLTDPASFHLNLIYVNGAARGIATEHTYAGVVTNANTAWWATAAQAVGGRQNQDLASLAPFSNTGGFTGFKDCLASSSSAASENLFQGGSGANDPLQISGTTKRFNSTMWIQVVGLRGGAAYPGGPMGLLIVQANGGTIYKFYNPGVVNGNGLWRRI